MFACLWTKFRFGKEIRTKRKYFAPTGSKLFPFRPAPFKKGRKTIWRELSLVRLYQLPLKNKIWFWFTDIHGKCGGILTNTSGSFSWHKGEDLYEYFRDCLWIIVGNPNHTIVLNLHLDFPYESVCWAAEIIVWILLTLSPRSFRSGLCHSCLRTCPLLQIKESVKNQN